MTETTSNSRYSYGAVFQYGSGRLGGGDFVLAGGSCPWPLSYAARVFSRESGAQLDPSMVALVGPVDNPECAISISPSIGAFVVNFPASADGQGPAYTYYSMAVSYLDELAELGHVERARRANQIFLMSARFDAMVRGNLERVSAQFRPDGEVRLVIGSGREAEIRDWQECTGLDPENLWLPLPEFDDYLDLEAREHTALDSIRARL